MCEANVYLVGDDGAEELLLEYVDKVIPDGEDIMLENIFSERKTVRAHIKEMALLEHRIVLERNA